MKTKVVIFGAGKTADHERFYLEHDSPFDVCGFTVDRAHLNEESHDGLPVVPFEAVEATFPPQGYSMAIAISFVGMNTARASAFQRAKAKGYPLITRISSRAITWPGIAIGEGCRVHEGAIIQPFVKIGQNVVIGSGAIIGHHTVIGDHCFISGGAMIAGNVRVQPMCFIGAGATIRDKVTIGESAVVGAGAVILEDARPGGVYRATPASLMPLPSDRLHSL